MYQFRFLSLIFDSVPPIQWVSWIPQLITSLCRYNVNDDKRREIRLQLIIRHVAKRYAQAVYLPIRTQYLSLKMENKHSSTNQRQVKGLRNETPKTNNLLAGRHQSKNEQMQQSDARIKR